MFSIAKKKPGARPAGEEKVTWLQRRRRAILVAMGSAWFVVIVVTFLCFRYVPLLSHKIDEYWVGVFAALLGELFFFTFVYFLIEWLQMRDPAGEDLSTRAKILYGENSPESVLNYNMQQLSKLSAYGSSGIRSMRLEEYVPNLNAYKVRIETEFHYKNLLRDVAYSDKVPWSFQPDDFTGDKVDELGRVLSIKIDGKELLEESRKIDQNGFRVEVPLVLSGGGTSTIMVEFWALIKVGENMAVRPSRFIEKFTMSMVNQLTNGPRIVIDGQENTPISLLFGQPFEFTPVLGVSPGERIFVFKFLAPEVEKKPESR